MSGFQKSFAVEIGCRYALVAGQRWPVAISPAPGELLSSWLHRVAHANGIPPRYFGTVIGLPAANWSAKLDRTLTDPILDMLEKQTGVRRDEIGTLSLVSDPLTRLRLPLNPMPRGALRDASQSFWLQFCPACIAEDESPHYRRVWTLATRVSCFRHGCRLRDRCPSCGSCIAPFRQHRLVGQSICSVCDSDLAQPTVQSGHRVMRIERLVEDLLRLHSAGHRAPDGQSILDLLGGCCFPSRGKRARSVQRLPHKDRYRFFQRLAGGVLPRGSRASSRYWTLIATAAKLHMALPDRLSHAAAGESHRAAVSTVPKVNLMDLLSAAAHVYQRREHR